MADNMNFAGISVYVQENADDIRGELVLGGQSLNLFNAMPIAHVGTVKVPKFTVDVVRGTACDGVPTGSTNILQTSVTTCQLNYMTEICKDNFRKYFPSQIMSTNVMDKTVPYESTIVAQWTKEILKNKEEMAWTGAVADGDCFNGLYVTLTADTARNIVTGASYYPGVTITSSNIDDAVDGVYTALPGSVKFNASAPVYIFMNEKNFALYRTWAVGAYGALDITNSGSLNQGANNTISYVYNPNVNVVGIAALNGSAYDKVIIAVAADNIILLSNGTNAEVESGISPYNKGVFINFSEIFGIGYFFGGEIATSF